MKIYLPLLVCFMLVVSALNAADKKGRNIEIYAYKGIKWTDSIEKVAKQYNTPHEWSGDRVSQHYLDEIFEKIMPKVEDDEEKEKELKKVRKILEEMFIIKYVGFRAGDSKVRLYWVQINDKARQSKLIDEIKSSKLAFVRVEFSEMVPFEPIMVSLQDKYGWPKIMKIEKNRWLGRRTPEEYEEKAEFNWRKGDINIRLFCWKSDDDDEPEYLGTELIKEDTKILAEFAKAIRAEYNLMENTKLKEKKSAVNQAMEGF